MNIQDRIAKMTGKQYMAQVARLSCLLCRLRGIDGTPAEVHHARKHGGLRSNCHKDTIPACPHHHRNGPDSLHRARRLIEQNYGMTEEAMAQRTREDVAALLSCDVRYLKVAA